MTGHRHRDGCCCLAACPVGLWDTETVAARGGLSPLMVRFLVANRCIPHVACGDRVRFVPAVIEAWAALCGLHWPDRDGPPIARWPDGADVHGVDDSTSGGEPSEGEVGSGGLAAVYELDRYRGRRP